MKTFSFHWLGPSNVSILQVIRVITYNYQLSLYHLNIWAFIRCIQSEENRFNHLLIEMKGGLTARPQTKKTKMIQKRIDTLYIRYENKNVNAIMNC